MAFLSTIKEVRNYFLEIYNGVRSLLRGMKVTGRYFLDSGEVVTQKYPENRATLKMFDNFKGELTMPHDENNQHACTACNSCARACPNGSINVIQTRVTGEDGRSKRILETYIYHLETCSLCGLCVPACDEGAIRFGQDFEHAVFDRTKLTKTLNQPDSTCRPKEEVEV